MKNLFIIKDKKWIWTLSREQMKQKKLNLVNIIITLKEEINYFKN